MVCKHVAKVEVARRVINKVIELTENEEALFSKLIAVVEHLKLKTILRIAGGWVRDRLLNRQSVDIDIVLDNCTGVFFAQKVVEHLRLNCKIGVSERNSEKSKHLETAFVKLDGFELDFVNLRTEEYEKHDSRVPAMEFGTASEDAFRRDFTINSLFYNIMTKKLEDFTGRGIQDLEFGLIETPLPSMQTFKDDPLRILRAIRFAARLNFQISEQVCEASQMIAPFLSSKVTNSRIGDEIDNYLLSIHPQVALDLLVSHGLCFDVFKPTDLEKFDWSTCLRIFKQFTAFHENLEEADPERKLAILYAAFLMPFYYLGTNVLFAILFSALVRPKRICDKVALICKGAFEFSNLLLANISETDLRQRIGFAMYELKDFWQASLQLALAVSISSRKFSKDFTSYVELVTTRFNTLNFSIKNIWYLDNIWKRKVLNGNELKLALKIEDPRLMSRAVLLEQRFNCLYPPNAPDEAKQKAIAFVKKEFYAYILLDGISLNEIGVEEAFYVFSCSSLELSPAIFSFLDKCKDKVFIMAFKNEELAEDVKNILTQKAICLSKTIPVPGLVSSFTEECNAPNPAKKRRN